MKLEAHKQQKTRTKVTTDNMAVYSSLKVNYIGAGNNEDSIILC
mgnify:FL=1